MVWSLSLPLPLINAGLGSDGPKLYVSSLYDLEKSPGDRASPPPPIVFCSHSVLWAPRSLLRLTPVLLEGCFWFSHGGATAKPILFYFCFFETGFLCVALAVLELTL